MRPSKARILDIASNNGRWSVAALRSGAAHVLGIEPRSNLVQSAKQHMQRYEIPSDRYEFIVGDVHRDITLFEPGRFDTILCLGFFYHPPHHFRLLEEFARLEPKHLILDTGVNRNPGYVITVTREDTSDPLLAFGKGPTAWAGKMSRSLTEDALRDAGFDIVHFDWPAFLRDLDEPCPGITDYADGTRVTIHAKRRDGVTDAGQGA